MPHERQPGPRGRRSARGLVPWLGLAVLLGLAAPVHASDSLSRSIFEDESESLWPIEVSMEIVPLAVGDEGALRSAVTVADGESTRLARVLNSPTGDHRFELEVVARHHARHAVELEYDLVVREARYEQIGVPAYLLHRLELGPGPELGRARVKVIRSDIVSLHAEPHIESVRVGDEGYEVRLAAASSMP